MTLESLGWDQSFESAFQEWAGKADIQPGRILIEFNYICRVWCEGGEIEAVRSGRLSHRATSRGELPAVGDWVVVRKRPDENRGAIVAVLPRRSWFSRRMAGQVTDEQAARYAVEGYERAKQEWPFVGVVCYWFFKKPSDAERNQSSYYFRMLDPDFIPRPVYDAIKDYTKH